MELVSSQPFDDFPIIDFYHPGVPRANMGFNIIYGKAASVCCLDGGSLSYIPKERRFTIYDEKELGISPWRYLLC